ncbi:unnamed protein product [Mycena citricolor]|uniref:Uncharacterized protein n=1 Tax=Mycena citricolor TaxID=2018698 RepID=A0AAD2JZY4_9AGAR|nr:unnamed protein product [Mycena citricolor]
MPGPSNSRRKGKRNPRVHAKPRLSLESTSSATTSDSQLEVRTPSPVEPLVHDREPVFHMDGNEEHVFAPSLLPQKPFIHDPGNGHRVRDTRAFLTSFFAQPPAWDDPLCAEFAQDEILEMLCTVLPEETALILWYNKSRSTSRICPACQRLYRLGDILPGHTDSDVEEDPSEQPPLPQLEREQEISGLCSTVCFVLASYNYPGAIKSAWGHLAEDMDEGAWTLLNSAGKGAVDSQVSLGLGMLVRMTRLQDLGLAQLCVPEMEFDDDDDMTAMNHV